MKEKKKKKGKRGEERRGERVKHKEQTHSAIKCEARAQRARAFKFPLILGCCPIT